MKAIGSMASKHMIPNILGAESESVLRAETTRLADVLARLDPDDWQRPTAAGAGTVARVAQHLTEGFDRTADAWSRRVDAVADEVLLHTFDDPSEPPTVSLPETPADEILAAYRRAAGRMLDALSGMRQADWSWPVWSPLGGVETVAEAARRSVGHTLVHRHDVLAGLGRAPEGGDEDAVRLTVELVLEALARRGGPTIPPPLDIEFVVGPPGAGTWTLKLEEPQPRRYVEDIWQELVGHHPEALERHRVERGSSGTARVTVRASGDTLWRAAFQRGATWADVDVHGDDESKVRWTQMIAAVEDKTGGGLGRVHH